MSRFRNLLQPHRSSSFDDDDDDEQFAPDGRNLSDATHPDYDPATDPELRLRITHTAAESIKESIREDDRRRIKRLASRRKKKSSSSEHDPSVPSPLKNRRSIFGRRKRRASEPTTPDATLEFNREELGAEPRAKLERQRTQANAAAEAEESARRQERQDAKKPDTAAKGGKYKGRRVVYVNMEGAISDPRGYERNKVRTSKYTFLSFVPKNLSEQFRRVANVYFLALVVLQVFPIFGAVSAQIGSLPLIAILALTAIKDGVEDSRRHVLDNSVNNSAVTRLGDWNNVNRAAARAPWYWPWAHRDPSRVSKGVKRLRKLEGSFDPGFLYENHSEVSRESKETLADDQLFRPPGVPLGGSSCTLDTATGGDTSSYPPFRARSQTLESTYTAPSRSGRSQQSRKTSSDVVSYDHATPGTAKWERTLWKKLEVGDIVLLKEDDQIPADIIVLATSDAEGVCYVETKNLDGETNLKPRKCLKATSRIGDEEDLEHARFWVDSEAPHANLYSYEAVLKYRTTGERPGQEHPITEHRQREEAQEVQEPVTINELLLRGCALRNTKWVIGLVIYTGADTKIMLNQGETPSKRSKIEKETNFDVLVNFLILMALCVGCAIADGFYDGRTSTSADYYEVGAQVSSSSALSALVTFGAALILFQNIVPISLVITVELVKTIQAFFIFQDLAMYYEPLDQPCLPKRWNISDDLGQIEYVFSDKTGTLTQNIMEFQRCAVGGVSYGEGVTEAMLGAAKREGRDASQFDSVDRLAQRKQLMIERLSGAFKNSHLREDQLTLISPPLADDLVARSSQARRLADFWRALAICHTVIAELSDSEDTSPTRIDYKAESPDEAALVSAARDVGFVFLSRTNAEVEIAVMGQRERYEPLRMLAFNSSRKRMSTITRTPENRILLVCKGADSVIYQRLAPDHDQELIESTTRHLDAFANAGLRTLCISSRYISEDEFARWSRIYDAACSSIEDREDEIERACEMIETNLTILGATALEDKLQVGVPEAIAQLHKAGLKLWILTGDKLQTAIEIGFSCNLLSNNMEIIILSADSEEGARAQVEAALDRIIKASLGLRDQSSIEKPSKTGGFAVVIDGETLRHALDDPLKSAFLDLTTRCETVVCCRVSPSQKALTVKLVKDGKNAMTLAIGDGANDVSMIQEAHIGVGIAGLEGAQASMSADYAVGQFRFLTQLLLVHGRWCYIRIADMHATFFYKNIVWTLTLFLYQIYCNFDATYLYEYTLIMLFNLVFTSLPVAVLGIFDRDVSAETALAIPQLYHRGILGLEWTRPKFFAFMLDGLYQSFISFFVPYLVFSASATLSSSGHDFSVWELGTTVAAAAVTSANLYVGLHIRYWTWMVFVIIFGSIIVFHLWIAIYSQFPVFTFQNELTYLYSTLNFWTALLLTQVASIGPKFVYKFIQASYFPLDSDIVREMEVLGPLQSADAEAQHKIESAPLFPPTAEYRPGSGHVGRSDAGIHSEGLSSPIEERCTTSYDASIDAGVLMRNSLPSPNLIGTSPLPSPSPSPSSPVHQPDFPNIPRIEMQAPTPRASTATTRGSDGDRVGYGHTWPPEEDDDPQLGGAQDLEGHILHRPTGSSSIDLHGFSPLQELARDARDGPA